MPPKKNKNKGNANANLTNQVKQVVEKAVQNELSSNSSPGSGKRRRKRNQQVGVAASMMARNPGPSIQPNGNTVVVSNDEFVTDLTAPGLGVSTPVVTMDINPSNVACFPWLSRIASGYELFRFRRLVFKYTPVCSTQTTGVVVMAFDYDASDSAPGTKQQMSAYAGSTRGNVWSKLDISLQPPSGWYYVGLPGGSGTINPHGTDIKLYDTAKFYLGLFNQASSQPVGELSVSYTIELAKPDMSPTVGPSEHISFVDSSLQNPAGTSVVAVGSAPVLLSTSAAGTLKLVSNVAGQFMLQFLVAAKEGSQPIVGASHVLSHLRQQNPGQTAVTSQWPKEAFVMPNEDHHLCLVEYGIILEVGTQLFIDFVSTLLSGYFIRARLMSYQQSLG